MDELKPCHCGSGARLHKTSKGKYWFECCSCWESSDKFWTVGEAIKDWNRRIRQICRKLMGER